MTPRRSGDLQPQATYKWKPTRGNLLNSILRNCMIFLQSANAWLFHPDHKSRDGLPFQAGGGQRAIAPSCNQWTDPEKKPNCPLSRHSTATHKSNHFDLELNQNKQNSMQQTFDILLLLLLLCHNQGAPHHICIHHMMINDH